jgi:CHAT domain-containing protein
LPPGINEIQASLDENIQLVEYKLTANKVLIFVVNKNNLYIRESNISREALDSLIYNFRETIGAESDREFRKRVHENSKKVFDQSNNLAEKLYSFLIAPVERLLDKDKVLYIIPDELLFYLPFAALVSHDSGAPRYLIEDFVIAYTPSAAILINNFEKRKPNIPFEKLNVLAVGNPVGDLAGSEEEVHKIADLFASSKLLLRNEATKAKFLAIAKNSFHVIHLATHSVINEKSPLYSYFVFGGDVGDNHFGVAATRNSLNTSREDDMLMAHEIFKINLSETRLVSLSACQTGCGKIFRGEGVIGISRAFMKGGASSIISTLWKIDDRYSMKITETFYHEWKNNNLTKANALRTAQLSLLNEIKNDRKIVYPHPFIWAGFTLLGDYK